MKKTLEQQLKEAKESYMMQQQDVYLPTINYIKLLEKQVRVLKRHNRKLRILANENFIIRKYL